MHRSGEDGLVRSAEMDQKRHDIVDWPQKERDGFVFTEINTVVNAFHIEALKQMAEMARAIGKNEDADAFEARVKLAKAAFQKTLFDESAGLYRDGVGTDHSSIHANFFPLAFGLVPDDKIDGVIKWLEQKKMQCSPYAAQYFMEALFNHGSDQKAMELMLADGDRSWKHMVDSGTTISWEAWDLKYKPNQDWNHAWGAAPANLLPRFVLGVQPAVPGWTTALIRPCPGTLKHARGRVPTPHGPIEIDWKNESAFVLSLELPDGMHAPVGTSRQLRGQQAYSLTENLWTQPRAGDRWILKDEISGAGHDRSQVTQRRHLIPARCASFDVARSFTSPKG